MERRIAELVAEEPDELGGDSNRSQGVVAAGAYR
jgi:hypothetical protein